MDRLRAGRIRFETIATVERGGRTVIASAGLPLSAIGFAGIKGEQAGMTQA